MSQVFKCGDDSYSLDNWYTLIVKDKNGVKTTVWWKHLNPMQQQIINILHVETRRSEQRRPARCAQQESPTNV